MRASGDDVLADSHPVTLRAARRVARSSTAGLTGIALITPDSSSIIIDAANQGSGQTFPPQTLLRYSARIGALQAVLAVRPVALRSVLARVLWTSPDGSTLLVTALRGNHSCGLLQEGHYTPIPWAADLPERRLVARASGRTRARPLMPSGAYPCPRGGSSAHRAGPQLGWRAVRAGRERLSLGGRSCPDGDETCFNI